MNAAPYIGAAIDSALAQTHSVLEVLVIDGGSTDGTRELVASYGVPVRLLEERQNGGKGLAAARNVGVHAAAGEWLAFLDADDWWDPRKTAVQLAELDKAPGAALIYAGYTVVQEGSAERKSVPAPDTKSVWPSLRWTNGIGACTVMARRDASIELGAFREDLAACEDWEMWVRLRLHYPFAATPEPLSYYRVLAQSSSHNLRNHLHAIPQVCGSTMLAGLNAWQRWVVSRRLWAAQLYCAAVIDRQNRPGGGQSFLWRSLAHWPFPTFFPIRYKMLLHYLVRRLA